VTRLFEKSTKPTAILLHRDHTPQNWQPLTITWICQYQAYFFFLLLFYTHLNANVCQSLFRDLAVKISNPAQDLAGEQLFTAWKGYLFCYFW